MLVGRGDQFASLSSALAEDEPVLLVGESGIGKTSLLRSVAAASGRRVFEGGALSTLSWLEYLALDRALGRRVAHGDPAVVAQDVEAAVGDGVLLLDDLQWAGHGTLETLELLAGRVGLLAGIRRGEAGADGVVDRLTAAGVSALELAALDDDAARELVRQVRSDLGDAAIGRVLRRAGGNPLLLRELAATGEPTSSLRLALAARLRRLDEAGREAFGVLALAGRPVSVSGLGETGAKSLLAADLAVAAREGEIQLRHALLGEVAVEQLAEPERRRLHAIIARAVDDPGEAARHYALAGLPELGFAAAMRAATASARPGERASHLAVAASCASGPEADALRIEAAWALEDANDLPTLLTTLDQLSTDDPDVSAIAALIRARTAWRSGDPEGVRTAIADGLELVSGSGSETEVRLRIESSRIPIFIDHNPETGVRSTTQALEFAAAAGVDLPRAKYFHGTALYIGKQPRGAEFLREAADDARASGDVGTEMLAANNLIAFHESMGDPQIARRVAAEYAARAHELGLGIWERSFQTARSSLDFHVGDYPAVLRTADELLGLPLEVRTREALIEQLCLALVDIGRIDEAVRRIIAEPDRPGDFWWQRQIQWVHIEAALWGGQPRRALDLAEELLPGPEGDLNMIFVHISRAWALFDLDRDAGPRLADESPAMLAAAPHEVAGVCLLHAGDYPAAIAAFEQAVPTWATYHRRGEVRCLWGIGEAARRAGAPDAVERLEYAEQRAQQFGMLPLLGRIHRSLRAAGVRRSAPRERSDRSPLTGREREVLRLVADGLTNAQIAGRLSVSRHTVVSQIASASAKLGASGRSHAAILAEQLERAS
jgi:DNA-binding CsgD family transcriptional regulator/tetratricopeptide (TPR) repeat protein